MDLGGRYKFLKLSYQKDPIFPGKSRSEKKKPGFLPPRKMNCKRTSLSQRALHRNPSVMGLRDMFYNGKSQASASQLAASGFVNPVKSFKKARQMLL